MTTERTVRMVARRSLTPDELKLRRLIAECFEVEEGGVRWSTPFDACPIGPNGPGADPHGQ